MLNNGQSLKDCNLSSLSLWIEGQPRSSVAGVRRILSDTILAACHCVFRLFSWELILWISAHRRTNVFLLITRVFGAKSRRIGTSEDAIVLLARAQNSTRKSYVQSWIVENCTSYRSIGADRSCVLDWTLFE
jgi:hypothetical protein